MITKCTYCYFLSKTKYTLNIFFHSHNVGLMLTLITPPVDGQYEGQWLGGWDTRHNFYEGSVEFPFFFPPFCPDLITGNAFGDIVIIRLNIIGFPFLFLIPYLFP